MLVRRSDVSFRFSIQRESRVTGAKAISSSVAGRGPGSIRLRTKRWYSGVQVDPGRAGFQREAGAISDSRLTLRGPVRRSSIAAIDRRQLSAAMVRSASLMVTCMSFSASRNVVVETGGPTSGDVPNAGGVPGVVLVWGVVFWVSPRQAA